MLEKMNHPVMYLICGGIITFVAIVCVVFMIRAWRAGKAIGMDEKKMKRAVTSSVTFSILPSVGILLGVIALSGSLGTPWPWLRLSVIGALHYETQVAQAAAEAVGIGGLSASNMTASGFATIAFLMSVCIMWGMVLSLLFNKKYTDKLNGNRKGNEIEDDKAKNDAVDSTKAVNESSVNSTSVNSKSANRKNKKKGPGFGDLAMTAMFIGLVSAYLGSYIGSWISGNGRNAFSGDLTPILVAIVSAVAMAVFTFLSKKKKLNWLESFSIAGSMLLGMLAAVLM